MRFRGGSECVKSPGFCHKLTFSLTTACGLEQGGHSVPDNAARSARANFTGLANGLDPNSSCCLLRKSIVPRLPWLLPRCPGVLAGAPARRGPSSRTNRHRRQFQRSRWILGEIKASVFAALTAAPPFPCSRTCRPGLPAPPPNSPGGSCLLPQPALAQKISQRLSSFRCAEFLGHPFLPSAALPRPLLPVGQHTLTPHPEAGRKGPCPRAESSDLLHPRPQTHHGHLALSSWGRDSPHLPPGTAPQPGRPSAPRAGGDGPRGGCRSAWVSLAPRSHSASPKAGKAAPGSRKRRWLGRLRSRAAFPIWGTHRWHVTWVTRQDCATGGGVGTLTGQYCATASLVCR